jgi:hypothetical protein
VSARYAIILWINLSRKTMIISSAAPSLHTTPCDRRGWGPLKIGVGKEPNLSRAEGRTQVHPLSPR